MASELLVDVADIDPVAVDTSYAGPPKIPEIVNVLLVGIDLTKYVKFDSMPPSVPVNLIVSPTAKVIGVIVVIIFVTASVLVIIHTLVKFSSSILIGSNGALIVSEPPL